MLGKMGAAAEPYVGQIAALLQDEDSGVQRIAAGVLGKLDAAAEPYAGRIAALLQDEDSYVRKSAAGVLGEMGSAAAPYVGQIAALLQDEDPDVQMSAAGALGKMGAAAAPYVGQIAALLQDEHSDVRRSASDCLKAVLPEQRALCVAPASSAGCLLLHNRYQQFMTARFMAEKHLILCHDQTVSALTPLEAFLEQLGASEYLSVLEDNEVGLDDLAGLSKDDLRSIGIPLGPASRIVKHMNQM